MVADVFIVVSVNNIYDVSLDNRAPSRGPYQRYEKCRDASDKHFFHLRNAWNFAKNC